MQCQNLSTCLIPAECLYCKAETYVLSLHDVKFDHIKKGMKMKGDRYSAHTSLIVATIKKLVPVGLRVCFPCDQNLIMLVKNCYSQVNYKYGQFQQVLVLEMFFVQT